ncbi:MAG: U32 family peptidase [Desulfomicrobium escambiense]|nr:U32 family peptidase [Desulfomicrobium escambiense]
MRNCELLAPAGSKASAIAAINAGANAIYLGGKKFGARAFAENFGSDDIGDLIRYAHLRGVSVYVTINTIVFDDEFDDLLSYADSLVAHDVDALIVQDLGVLDVFLHRYPNTPIHASTQMNVHLPAQAKKLADLGVTPDHSGARDLDRRDLRKSAKATNIELEVFVHGAVCVSYSGNCLFSALVGGRSGNRGECAQLCRLPYTLLKDDVAVSDESYLMSPKDLMTLERLGELSAAGIVSYKIEGRMRKPEYVAQAVKSYRKALDAIAGDGDRLPAGNRESARSASSTANTPRSISSTPPRTTSTIPTVPTTWASRSAPSPRFNRREGHDPAVRRARSERRRPLPRSDRHRQRRLPHPLRRQARDPRLRRRDDPARQRRRRRGRGESDEDARPRARNRAFRL